MLKYKEIQESILSIMLWLAVSLIIVHPVGLYLTPAILNYFHINLIQDSIDTLFMIMLASYITGTIFAVILIHFLQHRTLLKIGCVCIIIGGLGILGYYPVVAFPLIGVIGFGMGLIPSSAVCSVSAKIHAIDLVWEDDIILSPDSKKQIEQTNTKQHASHPIGILMVMPILVGVFVFVRSLISIYIATIIFAVLLVILLCVCKDFGAHHVQTPFKRILQYTLGNSIFWLVLLIITLTTFTEFILIYHLPPSLNTILSASQEPERKIIQALVFMILAVMRITVIIFTAISLSRVPPRRIILLCGIILGIGMILFYPLNFISSPFILFALALIVAVIIPALLKSCSNFISMGVLPIAITSIIVLGNTILFIAREYKFLINYPKYTKVDISTFYTIFGIIFLVSSLIFFFISYRKYKRME